MTRDLSRLDELDQEKYLEEASNHWYKNILPQVRQDIQAWIETIDPGLRRECRMNYLADEIRDIVSRLGALVQLKVAMGQNYFLQDEENELNRRYRSRYAEYGATKTYQERPGISPEDVERCRQVPIERLLKTPFIVAGKLKRARCPFHNEKTPSFTIYPSNGFHCFGCGKTGKNSIDYIMMERQCGFREAVEHLMHY